MNIYVSKQMFNNFYFTQFLYAKFCKYFCSIKSGNYFNFAGEKIEV